MYETIKSCYAVEFIYVKLLLILIFPAIEEKLIVIVEIYDATVPLDSFVGKYDKFIINFPLPNDVITGVFENTTFVEPDTVILLIDKSFN